LSKGRALKVLPSLEKLHFNLVYDPIEGLLKWRQSGELFGWFEASGYLIGSFEGREFFAHRLIYKMMTGEEPDVVDHIDGNVKNNKWLNFRNVSIQINNRNRRSKKPNPSGHRGISIDPNGKFRAHICANKKRITLGRFERLTDALSARKKAERKYNFHENHGKWDL
jgi:hypothetical protein